MKLKLSQKEIGQRIMELRKAKGMSQEDLAKSIGMSRPSLAQIELGNRNIDVFELFQLSHVLGFSMDEFLSPDFKTVNEVQHEKEGAEKKTDLRISVPNLQLGKFKNVLLYILERCAGKPNIGETVLNKLLYFCDFNFYELYEEHLTGARYKKLPYGPVPQKLDTVINQMIEKGKLKRIKTEYHGFPQTRFLPLEKADLTGLSAAEKTVIDNVIQQMSDWNANKISEYSHQDKPWKATKDGDYISYNLVFYRRPPFSVREYPEDEQN
ncbi:MAG TPA: type II toxin-antitoxin system antitoxin SocA domain-containing protein [Cyclobacteriaceae bacterium]